MTFKTKVIHTVKVGTCTVLQIIYKCVCQLFTLRIKFMFCKYCHIYTSVCMIPLMFMNSRATNSIIYSFMSGNSNHLRVASGVVASDQHLHDYNNYHILYHYRVKHLHHYDNYHILYHYRVGHPIHRELTEDVCVTIQPTSVQYV